MNPMLAALHKKMKDKEGVHPDLEIDIHTEHPEDHVDAHDEKNHDDVAGPAPDLEMKHEGMLDHGHDEAHESPEEMQAEVNMGDHGDPEDKGAYEGGAMHKAILHGLGGHQASSGGSLRAKASEAIRAKMASMQKHKKV